MPGIANVASVLLCAPMQPNPTIPHHRMHQARHDNIGCDHLTHCTPSVASAPVCPNAMQLKHPHTRMCQRWLPGMLGTVMLGKSCRVASALLCAPSHRNPKIIHTKVQQFWLLGLLKCGLAIIGCDHLTPRQPAPTRRGRCLTFSS